MSKETPGRWVPLEGDPEVFNSWTKKAGVGKAHFEEVYALDDEYLESVERPVKAVVLLFPIEEGGEALRKQEDERIAKEGQPKLDDTIFWVKQKIPNACGTIGLIHALANSDVMLTPRGPLHKFIDECKDKTPDQRADLLATTPHFASIHAATSQMGQSAAVEETKFHFTCFVQAPEQIFRKAARQEEISASEMLEATTGKRLVELDGRRAGPVDHGECKDLLTDVVTHIRAHYLGTSDSISYSLMVLRAD